MMRINLECIDARKNYINLAVNFQNSNPTRQKPLRAQNLLQLSHTVASFAARCRHNNPSRVSAWSYACSGDLCTTHAPVRFRALEIHFSTLAEKLFRVTLLNIYFPGKQEGFLFHFFAAATTRVWHKLLWLPKFIIVFGKWSERNFFFFWFVPEQRTSPISLCGGMKTQ